MGLSLSWPLLLRSTGSRHTGSVIVAHGASCSAACGIFPDQGSNPCPLHWQADSQLLRHQGSPCSCILDVFVGRDELHILLLLLHLDHPSPHMSSFEKCLFRFFVYLKDQVICCVCFYWVVWVYYIFYILDMFFKYFFPFCRYSLLPVNGFLCCSNLYSLKGLFFRKNFAFLACAFGVISKNPLPIPLSRSFPPPSFVLPVILQFQILYFSKPLWINFCI